LTVLTPSEESKRPEVHIDANSVITQLRAIGISIQPEVMGDHIWAAAGLSEASPETPGAFGSSGRRSLVQKI